jgi:dTDP-4-amino-4,6-dideoxygalactose transaminase
MKINLFTPPQFQKKELDINYLNNITNKQWQYSINGRTAIYHILKDLKINEILVPVYICDTVLIPLKKLKIKPIFYDLETNDLNASLKSIEFLSKKYNIKTLLVASMYGNLANLMQIDKYCKENNIFLIDDAAQSFGAKLDNRYIGTFGDAGFFSFSPGKPTAGHMGSFFWSNNDIKINRTKHCLIHYLRYLDIRLNRFEIYDNKKLLYKKIINITSRILLKFIDITNDDICKFENHILGGILYDNLNNKFSFRKKYFNIFIEIFNDNKYFKIINNTIGVSNPHKIVILFYTKDLAKYFIKHMFKNKIYVLNGYNLLTNNLKYLPNAKSIDKRVVELPIENNKNNMDYLFKKVKEFND